MPRPFDQTTRSLQDDRGVGSRVLICFGMLFFILWSYWLLKSEVTNYQRSVSAQFIQLDQLSEISASVDGSISQVFTELGSHVERGDRIVELDHSQIDARLVGIEEKLNNIETQLEFLEKEYEILELNQAMENSSFRQFITATENQLHATDQSILEQQRIVSLHKQSAEDNIGSELNLSTALLDLAEITAEKASIETTYQKAELELVRVQKLQHQERVQLRDSIHELDNQLAELLAAHSELTEKLHHYIITAPSSGIISSFPKYRIGQFIQEGKSIGTIMADSELRISADFLAEDALGHIKIGQTAQVKAVGFEWTRYGMMSAEVTQVSSSTYRNHITVQLEVLSPKPVIPLMHQMPVTVEVAVETLPPYALLLKQAGRWVN